jgi:site-specific DNA-cytosine methylase
VLEEAQPDGVILETPVGIEDLDFDGILFEMERIGYEVQTFDIPACAVDSPQIRRRYWIVGFLADTEGAGYQGHERRRMDDDQDGRQNANGSIAAHAQVDWQASVRLPCDDGYSRRAPDESVDVVNGLHRSLLTAMGNSIVPQVAYQLILNMKPFLCAT